MYAKVYRSLWTGSLHGSREAWAVFVFLLAHADCEGLVEVHPDVIVALTGFSKAEVSDALTTLETADADSRSPEAGGARIVRINPGCHWGWEIVNYKKYRTMKDEGQRREQVRAAMRRFRAKGPVINGDHAQDNGYQALSSVIIGDHSLSQEEEEVEADKDNLSAQAPGEIVMDPPLSGASASPSTNGAAPPRRKRSDPRNPDFTPEFEAFYDAYKVRWRKDKAGAFKEWVAGKCEREAEAIMAWIDRAKTRPDFFEFSPKPTRFLRERAWEVEIAEPQAGDGWD